MELRDITPDRVVSLDVIGYEFPDLVGDEFDSNWLVIRGRARVDGEEWSFQQPALLVDEAKDFGVWMREASAGVAPLLVLDDQGDAEPTVEGIEPNLAFGVVSYGSDSLTVRVFLRLESAPPSAGERRFTYFVDLTTSLEVLGRAAEDWEASLRRFPARV